MRRFFCSFMVTANITQTLDDANTAPNHIRYETFAPLVSLLRVLQRVWKPKKPKQCDCLTGSDYLPLHPIPETQSLMKSTDASLFSTQDHPSQTARGHHIHSPLETRGEDQRCPEGKGHTWACRLSSLIQQNNTGLFRVSEESLGCFFPRERDVTLSRLRKQQLHYRGGHMITDPFTALWVRDATTAWQHHYSLCSLKTTWN